MGLDLDYFDNVVESLIKYSDDNKISTSLPTLRLWISSYFRYLNSDLLFLNFFPAKFLCSKVFNYLHINYNGDLISCANLKPIASVESNDCFSKWQVNGQLLKEQFRKKVYFSACRYCYCDFPINLRISLLYFPFKNFKLLVKLVKHYLCRAKAKRMLVKR